MGVRLSPHVEGVTLRKPQLPPDVSHLQLSGLHVRDWSLSLSLDPTVLNVTLTNTTLSDATIETVCLVDNVGVTTPLHTDVPVAISLHSFAFPAKVVACKGN
mmetsp:Transcript_48380/g.113661  ORF Transcript_48380/g.113661 Transcript_48380/m.113661 type:complete len:102 (+) Transcript_48380:41-346(+)